MSTPSQLPREESPVWSQSCAPHLGHIRGKSAIAQAQDELQVTLALMLAWVARAEEADVAESLVGYTSLVGVVIVWICVRSSLC